MDERAREARDLMLVALKYSGADVKPAKLDEVLRKLTDEFHLEVLRDLVTTAHEAVELLEPELF
jgi:hypothetical protein